MPQRHPPSTLPQGLRRAFTGFSYKPPYPALYGQRVRQEVGIDGWQLVMPLGEEPEGLLLDRIEVMIRTSARSIYDVGGESGNVYFELGISLGLRQPVALTSRESPGELPTILRTPWLRPYTSVDECLNTVRDFLGLSNPGPMIDGTRTTPAEAVCVVCSDGRGDAIAAALEQSGRSVTVVTSASISSVAQTVEIADSFATVVAVRPAGVWSPGDLVTAMLTLGAAFGLRRDVVLAAGEGEDFPSDCSQLLVTASTTNTLADLAVAALNLPRPSPPPSGTMRPRIIGGIDRPQKVTIAQALADVGAAALDAEPGYGKTTALTQLADHVVWPTAWITVDADWSMVQLLERLVASVGEYAPAFAWTALVALRERRNEPATVGSGIVEELPSPAVIAQLVADDAERSGEVEDVLLILDDVHHASREGGQLLAHLIDLRPRWLRLLVSGRGLPLPITELSRTARLRTWTADDLSFSKEETGAYLREGGREADDQRSELLHQRTMGWPAALAVIRAWLDTHPGATTDQLRSMARGDRQNVYQIFATGYFTDLDATVKGDLLLASLPLRLDAKVAERLYGQGGGLRLRELSDGPYFITEEAAGTFRLHSLFRQFLGQRWVEERGSTSLFESKSALATWYLESNETANAFEVACEASDWDVAVASIEPSIRGLANRGDAYLVLDILHRLPEERIRRSRPLWESWVRALSQVGDHRAMTEAVALAAAPTGNIVDNELAVMLVAELRYEQSEISDDEIASVFAAAAEQFGSDRPQLALQARLRALQTRTVHSTDPDDWSRFLGEAEDIATAARAASMPLVAALALAQAGDLAGRIFQTRFVSDLTALRIAEGLGMTPQLKVRLAKAQDLLAMGTKSTELYQQAMALAKGSKDELGLAQVQLSFARFTTFHVMGVVLREGSIDEGLRNFGAHGSSLALSAATAFERYGAVRNVTICLNAAAESAAAVGDHDRRDDLSRRAEQVASKYGYQDLVATARRIRSRPTPLEFYNDASQPEPFHNMDPERLQSVIDEVIASVELSPADRELVRAVLRAMSGHEVYLDLQRENVCRYLGLLQDLRGPKIGPFEAEPPRWGAICRMRGIEGVAHHRNASALLRQFVAGVCPGCPYRSPATESAHYSHGDDEIYQPMLNRLASEDPTIE